MNKKNRRLLCLAGIVMVALLATSCRRPQMMADQPQFDPLEDTTLFSDNASSRTLVEGTVARNAPDPWDVLQTGKEGEEFTDTLPVPLTPELMARGRERFTIYCTPCHGRVGDGDGMIPSRGFARKPPSYHTDRLREQKNGYFFDVMTNGFGAMPSYASQIKVEDRWAIVAYVRALQVSQNATVADVPQADRTQLDAPAGVPAEHGEGEGH